MQTITPMQGETRTQTRLSRHDRKLFRGTAAEVHPWMNDDEVLNAIGANFRVEPRIPEVDGRQYPDTRLWLRSDNKDHLGTFGNRRKVIQPEDFLRYFRTFCEQSDRQINLDVVGTPDNGKTFYMGSKLVDSNLTALQQGGGGFGIQRQVDRQDRTDVWLIVTDYYGQSAAPTARLIFNELVCSNGMVKRVNRKLAGLSHLKRQNAGDVHAVLQLALEQTEVYGRLKERLMHTPITMDRARSVIRRFYRDPEGENRKVQDLERIYQRDMIGGELATRQNNAWRLLQAVTQYAPTTGSATPRRPRAGRSTRSSTAAEAAKPSASLNTWSSSSTSASPPSPLPDPGHQPTRPCFGRPGLSAPCSSPMPKRNPEWDRRYRARQRGEIPPPQPCPVCSVKMRRNADQRGGLCSSCWRRTDAGRAHYRELIRNWRRRPVADPRTEKGGDP